MDKVSFAMAYVWAWASASAGAAWRAMPWSGWTRCKAGTCATDVAAAIPVRTGKCCVQVWTVRKCARCGRGDVEVAELGSMAGGPVATARCASAEAMEGDIRAGRMHVEGGEVVRK